MRKIQFALAIIALGGLGMTSCDYVDEPVIPVDDIAYNEDLYGPVPEFDNATGEQLDKRVLLEDFTGQQCGNCPEAALTATDISNNNPGKVNIVGIHSGSLAVSDGDYYTNEFITEEGDIFFSQLSFQTNPSGRANRAPDASVPLAPGQWVGKVDEQLALDPEIALQMQAEYVQEDNVINVHVFSELLMDYENRIRMVVLITEGGIIGPQLDYSLVDDPDTAENEQFVEEYEFEHVLRGSVNGAAGVTVADNEVAGFTSTRSYTYSWNNTWDLNHSHLVAFAYDSDTDRVLNSIEIDLGE